MNSLTPLSCGACGGPSRVNVAGLHLAVTFPCGWCGKVTMVRCVERPSMVMPATCGAACSGVRLDDAWERWERDPAGDAREDCRIARYRAKRKRR